MKKLPGNNGFSRTLRQDLLADLKRSLQPPDHPQFAVIVRLAEMAEGRSLSQEEKGLLAEDLRQAKILQPDSSINFLALGNYS